MFKKLTLNSLYLCLSLVILTQNLTGMEPNNKDKRPLFIDKLVQWEHKQPREKFLYSLPRLIENHPIMTGLIGGTLWCNRNSRRGSGCRDPLILSIVFGFTSYIISREILNVCNIPTIEQTNRWEKRNPF